MQGASASLALSTFGARGMDLINPPSAYRVALIGTGWYGTSDLFRLIQVAPVEVVALCDVDKNMLEAAGKLVSQRQKSGKVPKLYTDYKKLLADNQLDIVLVGTPDHWHAQPAIEAALAGKHIYCQKPTSLTIEEGRTMSDAVRKAGVVFQLGSQQRSVTPWPQFKKACELVRNGRIGKLHTVRIGLPSDPPGGDTTEMPIPQNLNYDMWLGSTPYVY